MKKRGHIILGALLGFAFVFLTIYFGLKWFEINLLSILLMTAIIVVYSLLPDLDHKSSTITHWFFGVGILGLVYGLAGLLLSIRLFNPIVVLVGSTAFLIITYIAANFLPHRGKIHTVQTGIALAAGLWFLFNSAAYCALAYVAWHSHLFGDGYFFKIK
jgi:hypothetical protein